jgi:hypothetical protein
VATLAVTASNASTPATLSLSGTAVANTTTGTDTSAVAGPNVGGGGCTLASGVNVFDPVLLGLVLLAALALLRRRPAQP